MIPPRPKQQNEESVDAWLMSYADMITLLLCFFIIFVSVSEPKKERLSQISQGIASKFGAIEMATPFQGTLRSLLEIVETRQLLRDVAVSSSQTGIELEMAAGSFFKANSAELLEGQTPVLSEIAAALKKADDRPSRIAIESHTSDVPIHTTLYPSNWELSSARAARLARFFIEQGIAPARLKATGYADAQPKVPNNDANGDAIPENHEINQRVVVKLERVL